MNGHVPLGCCVMRLNRSERATAAFRQLGKRLMGTADSPDNLGGALVAVEPRWVETVALESTKHHAGGGGELACTFGLMLRHAIDSQYESYGRVQAARQVSHGHSRQP